MKYTGKAIITQIDLAQIDKERFRRDDGSIEFVDGLSWSPSITFLLTDLKNETPDTINKKLARLVSGGGCVTITVEKLTKRQRKLLIEKRERPNDCFCIEDSVIESHAASKAIRTFTGYHRLDLHRENPFRISVFRCATCGKEYIEEIWVA